MPQSALQKIATNWNWVKGHHLYPIPTGGYSWNAITPFLNRQIFERIDIINCQLKSLVKDIDKELESAKERIRDKQL